MRRCPTFLLYALLVLGCSGPPETTPCLDALQDGVFLTRLPWVHPATLDAERREVPWWLADTRWMVVDEDGWGEPEDWGAWGTGEQTRVPFVMPYPTAVPAEGKPATGAYDVYVRAFAAAHPDGRDQQVDVLLNGHELGRFTVGREPEARRLAIPDGALVYGHNELVLRYAFHLEPNPHDDRRLAMGFQALGLVDAGAEPDDGLMGPGFSVHEDRDTLLLATSGTYVVPFDVPADAQALSFEPRVLGNDENVELHVGVVSRRGEKHPLAGFGGAPLGAYQGRRIFLYFEASMPAGTRLAIRRPHVVHGEVAGRTPSDTGDAPSAKRPNVVVAVLDAARADHFGAYRYSRDTTPAIDGLAEEAIVFTQAVAECSYTLCSMPSLLAGLSFVDHGLVLDGLALRPEVRTLAERLAAEGYFTLGLTANPNSSRMTGSDQGFEEFVESWAFHPDVLAERALERLEAGWGERPLFLSVHFVPPHEPYTPDAAFDIFGDPDYDGPVTGERATATAIYDHQLALTKADREELVALYDGNLRMGDAAVGRLFAFLREAGLWDDTLVIVTSDHGEAFGEHGEYGHNTTIHEEMLRVPLIVKPPVFWSGTLTPPAQDGRLATLSDVAFTVAARLGLDTDGLDGRDVLAGIGRVEDRAERLVLLRSANDLYPWLGIRNESFKAAALRGRLPVLYDLAEDPDETRNVFAEYPLLHAGMIGVLQQRIDAGAKPGESVRAGVRDGALTDAQRRMLEALGYLQPKD